MDLIISLASPEGSIALYRNSSLVDKQVFFYYHDLDHRLIECLDELLRRTGTDVVTISGSEIISRLGVESTAHKVVEAFIEGIRSVSHG